MHRILLASILLLVTLAGCAGPGTSRDNLDERLLGAWTNEEGQRYDIGYEEGDYTLDVVDNDGEVFTVVRVGMEDGVFGWAYDVPSTGYQVTETVTEIAEDRLVVAWRNQTGSTGTEELTRAE